MEIGQNTGRKYSVEVGVKIANREIIISSQHQWLSCSNEMYSTAIYTIKS